MDECNETYEGGEIDIEFIDPPNIIKKIDNDKHEYIWPGTYKEFVDYIQYRFNTTGTTPIRPPPKQKVHTIQNYLFRYRIPNNDRDRMVEQIMINPDDIAEGEMSEALDGVLVPDDSERSEREYNKMKELS